MDVSIQLADAETQPQMVAFLKEHENYTLFLQGNLETFGMKRTDFPYSGNFQLITSAGEVLGVFCLTNCGNLLLESTEEGEAIFEPILASCRDEEIPIKGVVGRWGVCHPFWEFLKRKGVIQKETFFSKEVHFSIEVTGLPLTTHPEVRILREDDFDQWFLLHAEYQSEVGVPNELNRQERQALFDTKVKDKIIWGLFQGDRLVSMAELNAKAADLGQVGGVYTAPEYRQRGCSKKVMQQILSDAKQVHGIRKLIIFTGEDNLVAQKLYQSLSVSQIGHFALLFGEG